MHQQPPVQVGRCFEYMEGAVIGGHVDNLALLLIDNAQDIAGHVAPDVQGPDAQPGRWLVALVNFFKRGWRAETAGNRFDHGGEVFGL
ncbi:hypothetical protein D3C76_1316660 [compost metagenome]